MKEKELAEKTKKCFRRKEVVKDSLSLQRGRKKKKRWVREQRRKKKGKLNLVKLHANREGTNKTPNKLNVVEIKLTQ